MESIFAAILSAVIKYYMNSPVLEKSFLNFSQNIRCDNVVFVRGKDINKNDLKIKLQKDFVKVAQNQMINLSQSEKDYTKELIYKINFEDFIQSKALKTTQNNIIVIYSCLDDIKKFYEYEIKNLRLNMIDFRSKKMFNELENEK